MNVARFGVAVAEQRQALDACFELVFEREVSLAKSPGLGTQFLWGCQ